MDKNRDGTFVHVFQVVLVVAHPGLLDVAQLLLSPLLVYHIDIHQSVFHLLVQNVGVFQRQDHALASLEFVSVVLNFQTLQRFLGVVGLANQRT